MTERRSRHFHLRPDIDLWLSDFERKYAMLKQAGHVPNVDMELETGPNGRYLSALGNEALARLRASPEVQVIETAYNKWESERGR